MKFSIIIPVYNVAKYLRPCLDSVLAQTERDWECICIDDGSADGSAAILDEYETTDSRFVVVHQENAGVSVARNKGLEIASGEYVCFVDSDDWVDENWLDNYARTFNSLAVDLVMIGKKGCTHPDMMIDDPMQIMDWGWNYLTENGCPWLYSVKRCIATKARFAEGVYFCEDSLYLMQLIPYLRKAYQSSSCTYNYRVISGSGSRRSLPSHERKKYLQALYEVHINNPDIAERMFSNAAIGGALCWGARPKDFQYADDIHEMVLKMYKQGWIKFSLLRPEMIIPGWFYIKTSWTWPIKAQSSILKFAALTKRFLTKGIMHGR